MDLLITPVLLIEILAGLVVAGVLLLLYERLRRAQAGLAREQAAREETLRHDRETGIALRASTEREAVILSNIDEVVFRLHREGESWVMDFVSERASELLGYSPEEMLTLGWQMAHPDDSAAATAAIAEASRIGSATYRLRVRHQSGEFRWFECRVRAVAPSGREGPTIFGVSRDITEQLAAEEALRQGQEEREQAQKMEALGRLAGGVAHDFNNLLTTITGNATLVADQLDADDPRREPLLEIASASDRAQRFTKQLLAFSRKQVLETEPIDLGEVVSNMQLMLARLIGQSYRLEATVAGDIPLVDADRGQVEQVVLNLVVNARDAMPDGGTIHVRVRGSRVGGAHAVLEVEDAGVGIPPELRDRIFEPFFTTKEKGRGTGLGLAMVYGFVRQSGGDIDVTSSAGRGTCFRIYLPPRREAPEPAVVAAAPVPEVVEKPEPPTVLVVDDEPGVRHLASAMLRRAGYSVVEAKDGLDAQRVAESHPGAIDVLLTDIVMPGRRGPELADWFRGTHPTGRVIYMSGFRDTSPLHDVERGEALFLPKPFVRSALLGTVKRAVPAGTV